MNIQLEIINNNSMIMINECQMSDTQHIATHIEHTVIYDDI